MGKIAAFGARSGQETLDRVRNIKYAEDAMTAPADQAQQAKLLQLGMFKDRLPYASRRSARTIIAATRDWLMRARAENIAEQVRLQRSVGITRRDIFRGCDSPSLLI